MSSLTQQKIWYSFFKESFTIKNNKASSKQQTNYTRCFFDFMRTCMRTWNQSLWVLGGVWSPGWNLKELTEGPTPGVDNLSQNGKTYQVRMWGLTDWRSFLIPLETAQKPAGRSFCSPLRVLTRGTQLSVRATRPSIQKPQLCCRVRTCTSQAPANIYCSVISDSKL